MARDTHVVVATTEFAGDLAALTDRAGFRIDAIFPADDPTTAIVSNGDVRIRLEASGHNHPVCLQLLSDQDGDSDRIDLPGGSTIEYRPFTTTYTLPDNQPSLIVSHDDGAGGVGRAGMRYRDLIPGRWGGRFIASHITIPEGGPVPDYVHFHKVRFQMIFVKSGWVRLVYEGQGEPFVMERGDGVIQPPEIRHRVLESSPGLEVIEIGCPAEHETIADHALELPDGTGSPSREWSGQRFVRHIAADATYRPWRVDGWEYRDTGVGEATDRLAGARVARPTGAGGPTSILHDTEFAQLVVLRGAITFTADGQDPVRLTDGGSVAIPGGLPYSVTDPTADTELLDVTLPDVSPRVNA